MHELHEDAVAVEKQGGHEAFDALFACGGYVAVADDAEAVRGKDDVQVRYGVVEGVVSKGLFGEGAECVRVRACCYIRKDCG